MTDTPTPTRYFMKYNPARPITVGDDIFKFEICDYSAGAYRGVYKDTEGALPDSAINTPENKSGKAIEITEAEYLTILQKKRPSLGTTVPVDTYKSPNDPVAPSAEAEADLNEVDISKIDEVISAEDQTTKSVITSYAKLAEATSVNEDRLKELNKREDSPVRSTKGWKLAEWTEYLARIEEPTA